MPIMRKRLLATVALPLIAAGLAAGPAIASTLSSTGHSPARPMSAPLMLAQAEGEEQPVQECPPGTIVTAEGCVAEEPIEEAPPPEDVPVPEEAPPAEEPPAEEPPVEQPPAEEQPVEEAPVPEEAPAEEPAVEQPQEEPAPAEEPAAEEAPVEEAPEEQPAEEAPAEEAPVMEQQAPAEEPAAEEPAAEELPEEAPAIQEDQPAEEPAVEDVPVPEEAPTQDAPAQEGEQPVVPGDAEQPAEDVPADEAPAEEAPAEEAPAMEQEAPAQQPAIDDAQPLEEQPAPEDQVVPEGEIAPEGEPLPQDAAPAPAPEAAPEPELLDVEGGAPILDSAKEEPVAPETEAEVQAQDPEEMERLRQRIERLETQRATRPTSDAEAQIIAREFAQPVEIQSITIEEGQRLQAAPEFTRPENITIINQTENRYVYQFNNQIIVESNDRDRMAREAREVYYEELPRGRVREVVIRENGSQVMTIRNRYGDIIQRSRIRPNGEEVILFYAPEYDREERYVFRDPGRYLPPLQLTIPVEDYIYDSGRASSYVDYVEFFEQPPIEPLVETYSIEEVKYSSRVRDMMPRVDLDNITFEFGSASIAEDQVRALEDMANAMLDILERDDGEIFLLEGHTDAVGSDQANLVLSDRRAESVAIALTNVFGIPPENLQTQGYGKRYLKVATQEPERLNRRVAIRRITPLVQTAEAQ